MKNYTFTTQEIGLMVNMLNDLRKAGVMTEATWVTPEAKALFWKIQPIGDEKEYYMNIVKG